MPGSDLQEATPYYVRVVDDNKLLLYGDLHTATTDTTQGMSWPRQFRLMKLA